MRRLILIAATSLVVGISASSRTLQAGGGIQSGNAIAADKITVDQILEKYVNAIGGRAAIEKIKSRVSKGIITLPESAMCGDLEISMKAPNKYLFNVTSPCLAGFSFMSRGFNGAALWGDMIMREGPGIVKLQDENGVQGVTLKMELDGGMFSEFSLYSNIDLKRLFPQIAFYGKVKMLSTEAYVLKAQINDPYFVEREWCFDAQTGLLLCSIVDNLETDYLDYRTVDGIRLPFLERTFGGKTLDTIIKLTEIRHNVEIADSKFNPPPNHPAFEFEIKPFTANAKSEPAP